MTLHDRALSVHGARTLGEARARAAEVMRGFPAPWWIGGGWAIDMFLGEQMRRHADLDIAILQRDTPLLFAHLADWEFRLAGAGDWARWQGEPLAPAIHQAWARPDRGNPDTSPDAFVVEIDYVEFMFETTGGEEWVYRRDARIRRPAAGIGLVIDGTPVLAPEIVLLFKAKDSRPHDLDDFRAALPHLDPDARAWLEHAVELAHPECDWFGLT